MISQERLLEVLRYNPETGELRWIARRRKIKVGSVAGCVKVHGYRVIVVDGVMHYAHRLAFVMMTGECPAEVDHINRDRADNSWENLRPANKSQNGGNRNLSPRNTSGIKGVSWNKKLGKWHALIKVNGQKRHLGVFDDIYHAAEAYRIAAEQTFGEYANPATMANSHKSSDANTAREA